MQLELLNVVQIQSLICTEVLWSELQYIWFYCFVDLLIRGSTRLSRKKHNSTQMPISCWAMIGLWTHVFRCKQWNPMLWVGTFYWKLTFATKFLKYSIVNGVNWEYSSVKRLFLLSLSLIMSVCYLWLLYIFKCREISSYFQNLRVNDPCAWKQNSWYCSSTYLILIPKLKEGKAWVHLDGIYSLVELAICWYHAVVLKF